MRVLVTGATSLLGRHTVARLLNAGRDVVVLQRTPCGLDGVVEHLGSVTDADVVDPATSTHDTRLARRIEDILDSLPPREALIVKLRHGIGGVEAHTLEQIGSMLGITRERTRQLEARAFKRLREDVEPEMMWSLVE